MYYYCNLKSSFETFYMAFCNIEINKRTKDECTFSILIPSWNNLHYLQICIESIRKNSSFKHQLIVHINQGSDGTITWVREQSDIDFSYSEENIGVCYALNIGRSIVRTDYIVYVNDDMYLCPGWDKVLMEEINQLNHKYFFFSSTVIEPFGSNNCSIHKNFGTNFENFNEVKLLQEYAGLFKENWMGATWPPNIVHRDVWDLVGGYSIEFSPGMYSDPDFSMKLWKAGVRLFKGISASRAYHFGSMTTNRIVKNSGYYLFISKWGFTSSTFINNCLRRGSEFVFYEPEFKINLLLKIKNFYKRLLADFINSRRN